MHELQEQTLRISNCDNNNGCSKVSEVQNDIKYNPAQSAATIPIGQRKDWFLSEKDMKKNEEEFSISLASRSFLLRDCRTFSSDANADDAAAKITRRIATAKMKSRHVVNSSAAIPSSHCLSIAVKPKAGYWSFFH